MLVHIDYILKDIGEYGRFQRFQTLLLCLFTLFFSFQMLSLRYIAEVPETFCYVPEIMGVHSYYGYLSYEERLVISKLTIPWNIKPAFLETRNSLIDTCHRYNINSTFKIGDSLVGIASIPCDHGWVYHNLEIQSVATEVVLFARIGRKRVYFSSILLFVCFGSSTAAASSYVAFVVLRIFTGICASSASVSGYVLGLEFIGPNRRALYAAFREAAYTFGHLLLAGIGYAIRDWRLLQFFVSFPAILILIVWPWIPESPRWLMSKGRYSSAQQTMRRAAKMNKISLPQDYFKKTRGFDEFGPQKSKRTTVFDLFKTPNMAKKTIIQCVCWFVINCVYYGISIGTDDLFGDRYLDLLFNGALSLPANFSFILAIARFGRRRPLFVYFTVGGISLLVSPFIPESLSLLTTILKITSRFTVLASIGICIVYAAELFPTPVRGAGIGIAVTCARFGGITAPLLWLRSIRYWKALPMVMFGLLSIIAGSAVLILPETVGRNLPETMEEGESYGKLSFKQIKKQIQRRAFMRFGTADKEGPDYITMTSMTSEETSSTTNADENCNTCRGTNF
ncbi:organic cation transporter protein-like [Anneissia japonica]|uniref:organic cation transporter protein-like n=1 Tax=Anneissia japonica TaxID=1529436 RepID=UPI00142598D4|nr:organic cation transporter protein-like [Anneissia japonica]